MFCSKCGSELIEGAVFCSKCGAKVVYSDVIQQPVDISIPDAKSQQDGEVVENTQQTLINNTAKVINYKADDFPEESDKRSKSEKAINKLLEKLGEFLERFGEWHEKSLKKNKVLTIFLIIAEIALVVWLIVKTWIILLGILFIALIVFPFIMKNDYTDKDRQDSKEMIKMIIIGFGKIIAGIIIIMVIVSALRQNNLPDRPQAEDEVSYVDTSTTKLDRKLCGRWRTYEGDALALDEYGNVTTVFSFWGAWNKKPDSVTWEASNGCLTLNAHYNIEKRWKIVTGRFNWEDTYELFFRDGDIPENSTIGEYFRFQDGNEGLVGVWTPRALSGTLILNEDGTGMIGDNLLNWWADETILYYYPVVSKSYDYTVSGDILTIYFSDGSRTYTRVGD